MRILSGLTALLVTMGFVGPASAALTTYTSRADFEADAGALTTENFDAFATEEVFQTTPLDLGPFTLTGYGNQFDRNFIDIPPHLFDAFNIDGTTNVNAVTFTDSGLIFTFNEPILAWGADFADFQDNAVRSDITAAGETVIPPVLPSEAIAFFGFISTVPFTTVTFNGNSRSDGFGLDNVSWSEAQVPAAVPEPATTTLMASGLILLAGLRYRRSR